MALVLAAALGLGGCGGGGTGAESVTLPENFGFIVAEEPNAALAARDVLAQGGNAIDAGVAAYFAMAVTMPGAAGLAGGGVCLVHGPEATAVDAIDFSVAAAGGPVAGAGSLRGMSAAHARYGALRWEQVVLPAERLARFGVPVSRAMATAFAAAAPALAADPEARALFLRPDGTPLAERDRLVQPALAEVIARLRARGAGDLYSGQLSQAVAELRGAAALPPDARPAWVTPLRGRSGSNGVYLPPTAAGTAAHNLWNAGTGARALAAPAAGATESAGLVAVDRKGGAMACAFSLNGSFGTGAMVPGTGLFGANPPGSAPDGRATRTPLLVTNDSTGELFLALAASGGAGAAPAAIRIARRLIDDEVTPARALAAEPAADPTRAQLVHCDRGARRRPADCVAQADPRGYGLAAQGGR